MRLSAAHRRHVPFVVDLAIGLALVFTVTFFIVVMETRVGNGELTRAQLDLLEPARHAARSVAFAPPTKTAIPIKTNAIRETKENSTWPMMQQH